MVKEEKKDEEKLEHPAPKAPAPSSTVDDIQVFVADYLQHLSPNSTRSKTEDRASLMHGDGEHIYEITLEEWEEKLGKDGQIIHEMLRKSEYGYVRSFCLSVFLSFFLSSFYIKVTALMRLHV